MIHVGDIVIVQDSDHPRGLWRLVHVEELIVRQDGIVKEALVRVHSADSRFTHLQHPIQALYPLEVYDSSQECSQKLLVMISVQMKS